MSTSAVHREAFEEDYKKRFLGLPGSERYAVRKALYRPGTLVAYPLFEDRGAEPDQWAVALVRGCNWVGHVHWFMFRAVFCGVPSLEQAVSVAAPDELWWWQLSGDGFLHTDLWHVLGDLPGWDSAGWPEVIGWPIDESEVLIERLTPRRKPVQERIPLTGEIRSRPTWGLGVGGAMVIPESSTLSLQYEECPWTIPVGAVRSENAKRWRAAAGNYEAFTRHPIECRPT